jgi:hypothetical protein
MTKFRIEPTVRSELPVHTFEAFFPKATSLTQFSRFSSPSVLGRLDPGEISAAGYGYLRPLLSTQPRRPDPMMPDGGIEREQRRARRRPPVRDIPVIHRDDARVRQRIVQFVTAAGYVNTAVGRRAHIDRPASSLSTE